MYILNQPAPRAQILHRNGEHVFFCSIGDMLTYNQIPSPLGKATKIWVEVINKDVNPTLHNTDTYPWIDHKEAHYVTNVNRTMVMGYPVIALQSKADSEYLQKSYGGQLADWEQLVKQFHTSLNNKVSNR
jgi:nitrous oxide reductase accessory protein NosL